MRYFFCLLLYIFLCSCAQKNYVYFEGLTDETGNYVGTYQLPEEPRVKFGTVLGIKISSANAESDRLYNGGMDVGMASPSNEYQGPRYLVDSRGGIELPLLGTLQVSNLTRSELRHKLKEMLTQYLKDPAVDVRFLNTTVTVIGEVGMPATFDIPSENFTILQALGKAGDLTVYGRRDRVTVVREINGQRTAAKLNLNDAGIFDSPYYFLQANDVIYVEPLKSKSEQASLSRSNISIVVSVLSVLAILLVQGGGA
jgi:polysaccharide export outer membrane protein